MPESSELFSQTLRLEPGIPLWRRAPTRDHAGRPLSDFMMLIPRLNSKPPPSLELTVRAIEDVLAAYGRMVVFADLNLRLNVLWVTVRPVPGLCLELSAAIKLHVPEALLVAQKLER